MSAPRTKQRAHSGGRVIVVLGCRLTAEGTPSAALARRLATAHAAWLAAPTSYLVLSGGGQPSEAAAMRGFLRRRGVPDAALVEEAAARNTRENALFSWPLVRALLAPGPPPLDRVTVVTEGIHLRRALLWMFGVVGRQAGMVPPQIVGLAAPDSPCRSVRWRRRVGEALAYLRDRWWLLTDGPG